MRVGIQLGTIGISVGGKGDTVLSIMKQPHQYLIDEGDWGGEERVKRNDVCEGGGLVE